VTSSIDINGGRDGGGLEEGKAPSPSGEWGEGGGRAFFILLVDKLAYMFHSIRFCQNREMEYFFIYLRKFPQ
jgi:hypothetical protein